MDDSLLSAPNILQPIRKDGRITGNFTREEVDSLVQILKAGQLPAALTKLPIAENQIDATLGADTIAKGVNAIVTSLVLVLVFILVYYRFAGFVACVALVMNLAMILGTMVLINQPLTLPGLAGLVLTVGMSVDANVLIFERIREELKKGAAVRMAIRNGFSKATVTIVDANLTTLITAFVLYAIGTDQIRGFAVTLILGILFSMFTAIYVSRTIFDIAERHGFVSLKMADTVNRIRSSFSGEKGLDFVGKGKLTLALSGLLIVIGIAALYGRGRGIFDIDFAGGSSVQFRISEPAPTQKIRDIITAEMEKPGQEEIPFTLNGVSVGTAPEQTVYKVDSSQESVDDLKAVVTKAFEGSDVTLVTYDVEIEPSEIAGQQSSFVPRSHQSFGDAVMLTSAPLQEDDADAAPQESSTAEAPKADEPVEKTPAAEAPATDEPTGEAPATEGAAEADAAPTDGDADSGEESEGTPFADVPAVEATPEVVKSARTLQLGILGAGEGEASSAKANRETLEEKILAAGADAGVTLTAAGIVLTPLGTGSEAWDTDSQLPFSEWEVVLNLSGDQADVVLNSLRDSMKSEPVWISSSSVGSRVADDMIGSVHFLRALSVSLLTSGSVSSESFTGSPLLLHCFMMC